MKKFFISLFIIFSLFSLSGIEARNKHLIFKQGYEEFLLSGDYENIEQDLHDIENDYSIDFVIGFDKYDEWSQEEMDRLLSNTSSDTSIGLFIGENTYYIGAQGLHSDLIGEFNQELWNYYDRANTYKDGIVSFYQTCVKLINGQEYQATTPVIEENNYLLDNVGIFSDKEFESLNGYLRGKSAKNGYDIVVAIIDNPGNKSMRAYADDLYDYNNYNDNGTLFLISMDDRGWYFSTKGTAIDYVNDTVIDLIFDNMRNYLANGQYYQAFMVYADNVEDYMNNNRPQYGEATYKPGREEKKEPSGLISLIGGFISSLSFCGYHAAKLKSTGRQSKARNYLVKKSFKVTGMSDYLRTTYTDRRLRPKDDSGGGGGIGGSSHSSGGSFHTSSSGSSHGGHGGHF